MPSSRKRPFPRTVPGEPSRPRLLEFLAIHCGMGAAIGVALAGVVVLANMGNIGTLLRESHEPYVPMILFFASFALTFASLKMGMAVMALPLERDRGDDPDDLSGDTVEEVEAEIGEAVRASQIETNRLLGRRE